MKKIIYSFLALCLFACTPNLSSRIKSDVMAYKNCSNQIEFEEWLYSDGSEGTTIVEGEVTYGIYRVVTFEDEFGLQIEIKDGVAEYCEEEAIDNLVKQVAETLKNQSIVQSVYSNFGCVFVILKNEKNFARPN